MAGEGGADTYAPKGSGKFAYDPIESPKEHESSDGVNVQTGKTLPSGAAHPDKSGHRTSS